MTVKRSTIASTDTGCLVVIDPCLLFTRAEWDKIDFDDPNEPKISVQKKFKTQYATIGFLDNFGGDGTFKINLETEI